MREYRTMRTLRRGEVVDLEGLKFKMDVDENGDEKMIRDGDLYIAERNTGPHLLTAKKVVMGKPCECGDCGQHPDYDPTTFIDFILPTTNHYPFDGGECVKVVEAE